MCTRLKDNEILKTKWHWTIVCDWWSIQTM